jgi:hypothetical protein
LVEALAAFDELNDRPVMPSVGWLKYTAFGVLPPSDECGRCSL